MRGCVDAPSRRVGAKVPWLINCMLKVPATRRLIGQLVRKQEELYWVKRAAHRPHSREARFTSREAQVRAACRLSANGSSSLATSAAARI
eukprot:1747815-Pleurochrysis_carterae.AAC.1